MGIKDNEKRAYEILDYYGLTYEQQRNFWIIVKHIFEHDEFQRRMSTDFPYHGDITLGEHILSDAAVTYKLTESPKFQVAYFDRKVAVIIAMFHDLYTFNLGSNSEGFQEFDYNDHVFRHPVEAIINAISWYPEYFRGDDAFKIIDGVIHHMYPVPVKRFDGSLMELENEDLLDNISDKIKNLIIFSSNRGLKYKHFSICRAYFPEGRVMNKADKMVALGGYIDSIKRNISGELVALFTGANKNLENFENTDGIRKRR